jgi:hypothetical protein
MKQEGNSHGKKGYAAFSVSASSIRTVENYIKNQEAHHRKISYEAELILLLKKHGIDFILNSYSIRCRIYGARRFSLAFPALLRWATFVSRYALMGPATVSPAGSTSELLRSAGHIGRHQWIIR